MEISVRKLSEAEIERMGIKSWPVWEKKASSFDWYYGEKEDCLFLEGEVEVEMLDGRKIVIQKGDFVSFPQGLECRWNIRKNVRKHYCFGG